MRRSTLILFGFSLVAILSLSLDFSNGPSVEPIGPYLNGVFPSSTPGENGSWQLVDPLPNLEVPSPLRILNFRTADELLILSKQGEVWLLDLTAQSKTLVLDIKDRAFKKGDAGSVGMALHPNFGDPAFPDHQSLFIYYRSKPEPDQWSEKGFNRLSRFEWSAANESF
ncbi:MAG: hypothetical protein AAFO94_17610, partial [Bacteroidota bacterium]